MATVKRMGTRPSSATAPTQIGFRTLPLGFWAATLTAIVGATFAAVAVATPARSGPFCKSGCVPPPYVDVAQFIPGDYLWLIPGILLAPTFVVLMVCIHAYAREAQKLFARIAISFAVGYAVVISMNYFVQFSVVAPSLESGETQALSLFTQYNPHGFFIALEVLAYIMMSAAFTAAAPIFRGERAQRAIGWLFALALPLAGIAFIGLWLVGHDLVAVEVTILMVNWLVLILGGTMLAFVFRRTATKA